MVPRSVLLWQTELTGRFEVAHDPADAFALFTPAGERAWAAGWNPVFDAEVVDDSEPGVVFRTDHDDRQATWLVLRREPGRLMQYARVIPGHNAGTVTVELRDLPHPRTTEVTVSYRLSALSEAGAHDLAAFARRYDAYLGEWAAAIGRLPAQAAA